MVQGLDAEPGLLWREALGMGLGVGERDRLDRLDAPGAADMGEMDLGHEPIVAAGSEAAHFRRAGMEEVAEPVEDERRAV